MPALKPVPGVLELQWFHTQNGRTWSIRSFWGDSLTSAWSSADMTLVQTAAIGAYHTGVVNAMNDACEMTAYTTTDLTADDAIRLEGTVAYTGGESAAPLPLNVAIVEKFTIARRYRGGKNHVYFAGFSYSNLTDETHVDPTFAAGLATDWDAIRTAVFGVTTSRSSPVLQKTVSRFSGHVERVTPLVDEVVSNSTESRICTRRRRLPKIAG